MKYQYLAIIISLFGFFLHQPALAEIYKCKNAQGKVAYSNKPCKTGPNKIITIKESSFYSPAIQDTPTHKPKVEIYITQWCRYCKKAMAYFNKHKIPFKKYDIEKSLYAKQRKHQLAPNYSGIPLTVRDGQLIKGFSKSKFDKYFQ